MEDLAVAFRCAFGSRLKGEALANFDTNFKEFIGLLSSWGAVIGGSLALKSFFLKHGNPRTWLIKNTDIDIYVNQASGFDLAALTAVFNKMSGKPSFQVVHPHSLYRIPSEAMYPMVGIHQVISFKEGPSDTGFMTRFENLNKVFELIVIKDDIDPIIHISEHYDISCCQCWIDTRRLADGAQALHPELTLRGLAFLNEHTGVPEIKPRQENRIMKYKGRGFSFLHEAGIEGDPLEILENLSALHWLMCVDAGPDTIPEDCFRMLMAYEYPEKVICFSC